MTKVIDINSNKYPPGDLLEVLMKGVDDIESLIVIEIAKDGTLLINHTDMEYVEALGYLRIAEQDFIDKVRG